MANAWYAKGKEAMGNGSIDLLTDTIRVALLNEDALGASVDVNSDEFLSLYTGAYAHAVDLSSKSFTAAVLDAADATLASVTNGTEYESLIIYKWTGSEATSHLLLYINDATGLPITGTGANVDVTWSNGANKIAKL